MINAKESFAIKQIVIKLSEIEVLCEQSETSAVSVRIAFRKFEVLHQLIMLLGAKGTNGFLTEISSGNRLIFAYYKRNVVTRRRYEAGFGKIPTILVRRRNSSLSCPTCWSRRSCKNRAWGRHRREWNPQAPPQAFLSILGTYLHTTQPTPQRVPLPPHMFSNFVRKAYAKS